MKFQTVMSLLISFPILAVAEGEFVHDGLSARSDLKQLVNSGNLQFCVGDGEVQKIQWDGHTGEEQELQIVTRNLATGYSKTEHLTVSKGEHAYFTSKQAKERFKQFL